MTSVRELPFASVIVSFHNDAAFLKQCVLSLLNQSYPPERYEVILVNDGSEDESQETVSEIALTNPRRVRIIVQADRGPAAGRNLGIRNANGSIVAFTDPDCAVDQLWLAQHLNNYASEDVGGVEGRVETDWDQLLVPIRISPAGFRYVTCNISYRREVLEKIGLFDENFGWKEDDDLAYRVIKAGWKIVPDSQAIVYHPVRQLTVRGLATFALKRRYDALFYRKHADVAREHFKFTKLGRIALTPEFFYCLGEIAILVLTLAGVLSGMLIALLPLVVAGLWGTFHRRRMLRRRPKVSFLWMLVFIPLIEIGRLWGTIKFRQIFL